MYLEHLHVGDLISPSSNGGMPPYGRGKVNDDHGIPAHETTNIKLKLQNMT